MRTVKFILLLIATAAAVGVWYIYQSPTRQSGLESVNAPSARVEAAYPGQLVIPVAGVTSAQLTDTWGQSRESGARAHQAIDIMAPGGTPVVAAMAGRVEKLFVSDRGGITAYVRSLDGAWMGYYAHLQGYDRDLKEGASLAAGDPIGTVGDTGNSGTGNFHLHFALARMAPGEKWYQGTPVNPYPILAGKAPLR